LLIFINKLYTLVGISVRQHFGKRESGILCVFGFISEPQLK